MSTSYCVSPGKKYIKLREKYFDILDSFIVVADEANVNFLNNKIRCVCESMWLLGSKGLCFGSSTGVMSENGFYFKEHDKVLAVYPDGFSEFGYITSIYPDEKKCELYITDTNERLEYSFISKSPELLPGFAVREGALIGKQADFIYIVQNRKKK